MTNGKMLEELRRQAASREAADPVDGLLLAAMAELFDQVQEVQQALAQLAQHNHADLAAQLTEHDRALFGDKRGEGRGLVGDMRSMRTELRAIRGTLLWIGGLLTSLVAGLLWALLTGQATLVFH